MRFQPAPTKNGWRFVFEITEDYKKVLQEAGYNHEMLDEIIGQRVFDEIEECMRNPANEEFEIDDYVPFQDADGKYDNAKLEEVNIVYTLQDDNRENAINVEDSWIQIPDIDWSNPEGIGESS